MKKLLSSILNVLLEILIEQCFTLRGIWELLAISNAMLAGKYWHAGQIGWAALAFGASSLAAGRLRQIYQEMQGAMLRDGTQLREEHSLRLGKWFDFTWERKVEAIDDTDFV